MEELDEIKDIEQLKEYRKKISELSEEEKKQRDLYLKKLSSGEIYGPQTGFASIDKQWLKYYEDDAILSSAPEQSLYQYLYNSWKDNLDLIAVEFEGTELSRYEILLNICKIEDLLKDKGIKKGDVIALAPANIPEAIYIIYAANKLGAKVSIIDPRANAHIVKQDINESSPQPKIFIGVETVKKSFISSKKHTSIEDFILISPMESSSNKPVKTLYNILRKINGNGRYSKKNSLSFLLKEYHKEYSISDFEKFENFGIDEMAFILHTGGTTGTHKGVELSNNALNNTVFEHNYLMDGKVSTGDIFVNPLPQFITYGFTSMHLGLCKGFKVVLLPVPTPKAFRDAILTKKAKLAFGGPIHWESFCNSINPDKDDLSFLRVPVAGGEKIPLSTKENANKIFEKCNCSAKLFDGYGLSETCGVFSVAIDENTVGSVGKPLVYNNVGIFDSESKKELYSGQKGEIYITGKSMMNKYHNNEIENEKAYVEIDGIKWFKTGDVGMVSPENGELYIQGRIKRIFVCGVDKVYQEAMEELICTIPYIQKCVVVAIPDKKLRNVPKVHIVLKEEYRNKKYEKLIIAEIEKLISEKISKNVIPHYYEFQEKLLYTPNGKVDFKKIQEEDIKELNEETIKIK